jgi:hypothetical protein
MGDEQDKQIPKLISMKFCYILVFARGNIAWFPGQYRLVFILEPDA